MNSKKIVLMTSLISTFVLSSCGKNIYKVRYNYNLDNYGIYLTSEVKKDEAVVEPEEPNVEDFVFEGWYKDKEGTDPFIRFGLAIDKDIDLYAKWSNYSDLSKVEKIERFQAAIETYSYNSYHVIEEIKATIGYPGAVSGSDGVFYAHDKRDYHRYKDITTIDYYTINENNEATLYGNRQYYYDEMNFYNIYIDLEDSKDNEYNKAKYDSKDKESLLDINFSNLYSGYEDDMIFYLNSNTYDEETFDCEFNFNYTKLNKSMKSYTYQEAYSVAIYSDSLGAYATYVYILEYGLVLRDGLIRAANIYSESYMYLGEEIIYYCIEQKVTDFIYSSTGEYSSYQGERFTYNQ